MCTYFYTKYGIFINIKSAKFKTYRFKFFHRYFKRFDVELEQLRIGEKIKGRQQQTGAKFSRENNIKMVLEREQQVYESTGLGDWKIISALFLRFRVVRWS